ncbi:kizuna centrosomal protein [Phyllostomus discolor]|uniref:Centrosomal protein kizuna n=1 Tax=Phyllostomus discolor TaxID=89673 RepID=A0A834DP48_9CHIR|nr:kizuna centrosomal protein [Phyllostomus discolor]
MRLASATSSFFASPDYYERLGRLQQGLRERLYNHSDILKEDLEDCRPAVLHQLLRLSPGGGTDEKQVRSEQACALSLLRAQLGQHVSTLKEHDNSAKEEIGKLSEVFLVKNVDQGTKA